MRFIASPTHPTALSKGENVGSREKHAPAEAPGALHRLPQVCQRAGVVLLCAPCGIWGGGADGHGLHAVGQVGGSLRKAGRECDAP